MTWMSKLVPAAAPASYARTTHFLKDGSPLCASMRLRDGSPYLAPFTCRWTDRRPEDHLCRYCRHLLSEQMHAGAAVKCTCGKCTPQSAKRIQRTA